MKRIVLVLQIAIIFCINIVLANGKTNKINKITLAKEYTENANFD